jgi:DNA-binding NarL/FixJ family response regulator
VKRCLLISKSGCDLWLGALRSAVYELDREIVILARSEIARTHERDCDLVILDAAAVNDLRSLLSAIWPRDSAIQIVVFSSMDDWRQGKETMLVGVFDYTPPSFCETQINGTLMKDLLQRVSPAVLSASEVSGVL